MTGRVIFNEGISGKKVAQTSVCEAMAASCLFWKVAATLAVVAVRSGCGKPHCATAMEPLHLCVWGATNCPLQQAIDRKVGCFCLESVWRDWRTQECRCWLITAYYATVRSRAILKRAVAPRAVGDALTVQ